MRDDGRVFELAARHGVDPEVIAELVEVLVPTPRDTWPGITATASDAAPTPPSAHHLHRLQLLGQGGMAEVWEADDTQLGRRVAMKVLRADLATSAAYRDRFVREAQATAQTRPSRDRADP